MVMIVCFYAGLLVIMTLSTVLTETHPFLKHSVIDGIEDKANDINVIAGDSFVKNGELQTYMKIPVFMTHNGQFAIKRKKRAFFVKLAKKGIRAVKYLLKDTVAAPYKTFKIRESRKQGTMKTALEDFYSTKPTYVQKLKFPGGVTGRSGYIGDRTIILKNRGEDGRPTIEIMQTHKNNPLVDRITYTKNNPAADSHIEDI